MSVPLVVSLLRHGEVAGPANVYRGMLDPPLTADGWRRMERVLGALPAPAAIACSPLVRCREPAERHAGRCGAPLSVLDAMREMRFGAWEGLTPDQASARDPLLHAAFRDDPRSASPPGGESYASFVARVREGFDAWRSGLAGEALLVAHAGVIRVLLGDVLCMPPSSLARIALPPAAVARVSWLEGASPCLLSLETPERACEA